MLRYLIPHVAKLSLSEKLDAAPDVPTPQTVGELTKLKFSVRRNGNGLFGEIF